MITQSLEKQHVNKFNKLYNELVEKEAMFVKKDREMQERMKYIQEENEQMEKLKTVYESARTKSIEDLIKIERKLDEEV